MPARTADVLIIGAGAAGLACAAALTGHGQRVPILEARDRIGGRIHTVRDPGGAFPIELGAEFIHGRPREIFDLAEAEGLAVEETGGRMLQVVGGQVIEDSEGGPILDDVKRLDLAGPDESFQSFLDHSFYSSEDKVDATGFVEGFNAAYKEEVSVLSLAKDLSASDAIEGDHAFRLRSG
jgi:glycine/D-amino acid oxidase-like deaminating enzyme